MTEIITKAEFDYLWVQFYNNQGCSVNGPINYNDWRSNIANTPSATAKIFIGVPASPLAATSTESGSQYYLTPDELSSLVRQYEGDSAFGGVMMWSAAWPDSNVISGDTYAQEAKQILSGSTSSGSGSGSESSTSSTVASTAVASTATASGTVASTITLSAAASARESGTVAQWDQVRTL
jgi:chitinase